MLRLNLVVSPADRDRLTQISPGAEVALVPNGVDIHFYRPSPFEESANISFVGGTDWHPNEDAMAYFLSEILPLIRSRGIHAPVYWVGNASRGVRRRYSRHDGFTLTGHVDDVRPYLRKTACYVVPLRMGGGTRLKILEAWAMGKAVVSTSIGCEGLAAVDGENILVRDDPEAFADAVDLVIKNPALRSTLEQGGRETAERHYSWESIGRTLRDLYAQLV